MSIKKYSDFGVNSKIEQSKISIEIETVKNDLIEEDVLLSSKNINDDNIGIEVLEENIIKFNGGNINDIMSIIKKSYSDIDFFIRKKDNELHIVKYNENIDINTNQFINSLLKFYSANPNTKRIIEGIKVKGNNNFTIIENMKTNYSEKFINDMVNLLVKKMS